MEGAVAVEEGGVGDGAEPRLAGEGRAEEPFGLVRRQAKEDLADDVVNQLPRRRRRRRHGVEGSGRRRLRIGDFFFFCVCGNGGIRRLRQRASVMGSVRSSLLQTQLNGHRPLSSRPISLSEKKIGPQPMQCYNSIYKESSTRNVTNVCRIE